MFIYVGALGEFVYKLVEFFIVISFLVSLSIRKNIILVGGRELLYFIAYLFTVSLLYGHSIILLLLFLYNLLPFYLIYLIIINFSSHEDNETLLRDVKYLLMFQVVAAVIKLIIFGQNEIPLFLVGSDLTTYVFLLLSGLLFISLSRQFNAVVLSALLLSFMIPLIGAKRGAIIFFPLMILYLQTGGRTSPLKLFGLLFFAAILLYLGVVLIPTLNPENVVGGRFDLEYLTWYLQFYTLGFDGNNPELAIGRTSAIVNVFTKMIEDGPQKILFGYGPGIMLKSGFSFLDNRDFMTDYFNVKYGTNSLIFFGVQTGIIGTLLWIRFVRSLLKPMADQKVKKLLYFIFVYVAFFYSAVWKLDVIIIFFYLISAIYAVKSSSISLSAKL